MISLKSLSSAARLDGKVKRPNMRTVVVYKQASDYARTIEDFLRDFEHQTGHTLEVINPDTPAGDSFCAAYDIVEYPSLLAISSDGQVQTMWQGLPLPTISEVSYYAEA